MFPLASVSCAMMKRLTRETVGIGNTHVYVLTTTALLIHIIDYGTSPLGQLKLRVRTQFMVNCT